MTTHIAVGAFGATVNVTVTGLTDDEALTLRDAWSRCQPTSTDHTVALSAAIGVGTPDALTLSHRLSTQITLALIELARDRLLLLHACAVAHPRTGTTIAFIGPSGRGKTTAVTTLDRHFSYITDETVAVDTGRTVLPYPKPLSVVQPGTAIKNQVSPDDLGLLDITDGILLRLNAVMLLDRRPDAPATPTLSPVGLVDAIDDLVPQISYLSSRPRPLLHLANLLADVGGIRRLSYRDSEQLPDLIEKELDALPAAVHHTPELWKHAPTTSTATTGIRRSTVLDAIDDGHHVIVLHGNMVRVLGSVASEMWRNADGISVQELTTTLVNVFGTPPDGDTATLVDTAIQELRSLGLLATDNNEVEAGVAP